MKKRLIFILLACVFTFTQSACNTLAGLGKDVEKAGEAIQRSTK